MRKKKKMPFDGSYGHHLDEEFGWSGRNASEVVGEGKRLLRVAYVAYQRTAEQIAGGAAKSVGHKKLSNLKACESLEPQNDI